MAVGDKAAAKGLAVYASTQDKRLGYNNDNQRGDDIADEIDARLSAATVAAATAAAATALKFDAAKVVFSASQPAYAVGTIWLKPV